MFYICNNNSSSIVLYFYFNISVHVLQLSNPGRLPESGLPVIENKCAVMDFVMNPFDEQALAVGKL